MCVEYETVYVVSSTIVCTHKIQLEAWLKVIKDKTEEIQVGLLGWW